MMMELLNYKGRAMSGPIVSFRATMSRFLNNKIQSKAPTPHQSPSTNSAPPIPSFDFKYVYGAIYPEDDDMQEHMERKLQKSLSTRRETLYICSSNNSFISFHTFCHALVEVIKNNPGLLVIEFAPEFNNAFIKSDVEKLIQRLQQEGFENVLVKIKPAQVPDKIKPPSKINTPSF
jgi:hypothetical protein